MITWTMTSVTSRVEGEQTNQQLKSVRARFRARVKARATCTLGRENKLMMEVKGE